MPLWTRSVVLQRLNQCHHTSSTGQPHQSLRREQLRNITPIFCKTFVILRNHRLAGSRQLSMKSKYSLTVLFNVTTYLPAPLLAQHTGLEVLIILSKHVCETGWSLMSNKAALMALAAHRTNFPMYPSGQGKLRRVAVMVRKLMQNILATKFRKASYVMDQQTKHSNIL